MKSPIKNTINHLWLFRQVFKRLSTRGQIYLNGQFKGYTLEDECRLPGIKVKHHTAIDAGTYEVVKHSSGKYPRSLRLENVERFTGILIHALNNESETSGCIGVGGRKSDLKSLDFSTIGDSKAATNELIDTIYQGLDDGIPCYITITNNPPE